MVQGSRSWQPGPLHGNISTRAINKPSRSFTCEGVAGHVPQRHAQHQGHRHPRPGRGAGYLDTCYVVATCYVWPRVTRHASRHCTLFSKMWGAYVLMQLATPRWYTPMNPDPANERFIRKTGNNIGNSVCNDHGVHTNTNELISTHGVM